MTGDYIPSIYAGPGLLSDLEGAMQLEWLVTNGLGSYASSTVASINTRKYHGLLISAFNPPVDRHVLLSKIDEEIRIGSESYPLGSNEFVGNLFPDGFKRLRGFGLHPFPTFRYEAGGIYLKKEIFMPYLRNMVVIYYEVLNSREDGAIISLHPLINARHFYETTDRHIKQLRFTQDVTPNGVVFETEPSQACLAMTSTDGKYVSGDETWIERIYFRADDARGERCTDDNYHPGSFTVDLPAKETKDFYFAAVGGRTRHEVEAGSALAFGKDLLKKLHVEELARRERLLTEVYQSVIEAKPEDWLSWLVLAADSFIVTRRSTGKKSVVAGYHWFEDWGRDTLISLPGLTLVTGRFRDAEEVLLTFKQYCRDGLIPNRFPDRSGDEPVYDSVDATLWFFNAVLQYLKYTGRFDFVHKELWDCLQDIVERHIRGTAYGICMDDDGLLRHGARLTWMDVSIGGSPVTPREGKAVEIEALWYNALRTMEMLALRLGQEDVAREYDKIAQRARTSFNEKFWLPKDEYLLDVVDEERENRSLRPNQVIASCLDYTMLNPERREKVVQKVWKRLWGTYGLRTLASDDPRYIGACSGGFVDRDRAYHNGTVWAWLLGPFVTAFLRAKNYEESWRRFAFERFLQPLFLEETYRAGLGTLSEISDGDPPHSPRGCISQAWSVAEPLRAYVEDILLRRPAHEKEIQNRGAGS